MSFPTRYPMGAFSSSLNLNSALQAAGYPASSYPYVNAQYGQESSYGAADPVNPLQITAATAANPGYGVAPMNPADLKDPSKGQSNLIWALRYQKARAGASGHDLSTIAGIRAAQRDFNGGGDPLYNQHIASRLPSALTAQYAQVDNGVRSDATPAGADTMGAQQAPTVQSAQQDQQQPPIQYTPPPLPSSLQSITDEKPFFGKSRASRDLYALAAGLLQGRTLGQGLGLGLQNMSQNREAEDRDALDLYGRQTQQAQQLLLAQKYGGAQQINQQNADTKGAAQIETARHNGATEDLTGKKVGILQGGLNERVAHDRASEGNAATNAAAHVTSANAAAQQAGAPGMSVPGTGTPVAGVAQSVPGTPVAGAVPQGLPGVGASGLTSSLWPSAGSNTTPLIGTRALNQQMQANNKATAKESDEDTAAIEAAAKQDAMLDGQVALIDKQNEGWLGTGGLGGRLASFLSKYTADPTVSAIQKEGGGLLIGALPHGVGALRIPEIHAVQQTTPGMDTPQATAHLIRDQTKAQNNEISDVLQARQEWIADHPGQSAAVGFDPIGNDYFRKFPAYTEKDGKIIATQRPSVREFAEQRSKGGAYSHLDPDVQQAASTAFPTVSPAHVTTPSIPQGAIEMLRSDPSLSAQFDMKYGAGASESILKGK